jgi:hypothetical protein
MVTPFNETTFEETVTVERNFLPEAGPSAHARFLDMLHNPGETWIFAFTLNDPDLLDEIDKADANGVVGHLLIDHTQFTTPGEHQLLLTHLARWKHWDVTITTAGIGSSQKSQIWHYKVAVVDDVEGGEPLCMEGSCNLSGAKTGWAEGNLVSFFRSAKFAGAVVAEYLKHRDWARENEARYQVQPDVSTKPPTSVMDALATAGDHGAIATPKAVAAARCPTGTTLATGI